MVLLKTITKTTTLIQTNSDPYCEVEGSSEGFTLTLFRLPVPASRPKVSRWSTYYLKTYEAYRQDAQKAIPRSEFPPLEGNLFAEVEFVCHKPKTTKRSNPRGDIDNYLIAIFDAITGHKKDKKRNEIPLKGYWNDDDQLTSIKVTKRFCDPGETPHTRVYCHEL